jgi:hypothetical protein
MNAWADGLNFYLVQHPEVKPRVIQRFEPWMALSFTEGSIGGDIERVDLQKLEDFYGKGDRIGAAVDTPDLSDDARAPLVSSPPDYRKGMPQWHRNRPSNTVDHDALLLINPHTSFFFRSELQMVSNEGLDAYGAVTWGQFFIYQGFNDRAGWMHTSSGVDAVDEYLETVTGNGKTGQSSTNTATKIAPVIEKQITVPYKTPAGMARRGSPSTTPPTARSSAPERQVGRHQAHAGANQGARTVLPPHQGQKLQRVLEDHGTAGQLLEQHHLRRRRWRHRLLSTATSSPAAIPVRLHQTRRWQRPRHRLAGLLTVEESRTC